MENIELLKEKTQTIDPGTRTSPKNSLMPLHLPARLAGGQRRQGPLSRARVYSSVNAKVLPRLPTWIFGPKGSTTALKALLAPDSARSRSNRGS